MRKGSVKKMPNLEENKKVQPIFIKDPETGEVKYTLEFNRKTVALAERRGFVLDNIGTYPLTACSDLFYWSLQMHHPRVSRDFADTMFDELGGIQTEGLMKRLVELYNQAMMSTKVEDGDTKNSRFALEM